MDERLENCLEWANLVGTCFLIHYMRAFLSVDRSLRYQNTGQSVSQGGIIVANCRSDQYHTLHPYCLSTNNATARAPCVVQFKCLDPHILQP
jgi:hypothetical protein